jgi:hypothetical protein
MTARGSDEVFVLVRIELLKDLNQSPIAALKSGLGQLDPDFADLLQRQANVHGA